MNTNELSKFYEKLYFHEIDMREHLTSRLQIPLAILVVLIGFLAYMLKNLSYETWTLPFSLFVAFYVLSIIFTLLALIFLVKSWIGFEYSFLPSAKETEGYRNDLIETYKGFEESSQLVDKYLGRYLYDYFVDCSSINTANNDKRSMNLHYSRICIISAVLLAFIAFVPFRFGKIDKSCKSTPVNVNIVGPVEFKEKPVNQTTPNPSPQPKPSPPPKPPSPPKPPPKRIIKEGVKIKK